MQMVADTADLLEVQISGSLVYQEALCHEQRVLSAALTSDAQYAMSGSADNTNSIHNDGIACYLELPLLSLSHGH